MPPEGSPQTHDLNGEGIAAIVATPGGQGYWMTDFAADVLTFGNASLYPPNF
jgi:hypothetical protein